MTISNYDDIIDSRDIIERIEELQDQFSTCPHCGEGLPTCDGTQTYCPDCEQDTEFDSEEVAELAALVALQEETEGYAPDWHHGATLIRESYFTDYAMEMLADIGDLPHEIPHYIVIDEEATAENIKVDYTEVEFDGVSYLVR